MISDGHMASQITAEPITARIEAVQPALRRSRMSWAARAFLVDVLMLALGGLVVQAFSITTSSTASHVVWYSVFAVLSLVFLGLRGAYHPRLRLQIMDEFRVIVASTAVAAMTTITIRILATDDTRTASETVKQWVFATAFLAAGALVLVYTEKRARRQADAGLRTLIIGAGKVGQLAAKRLLEQPEFGLKPIGYLDKEPLSGNGSAIVDLPILGASWDLVDVLRSNRVDHVVVTFSTAPHNVLLRIVKQCQEYGVAVSMVPRLFEKMTDRLTVERLGGLPLVSMEWTDPKGWQFAVKYFVDRVVALVVLLLLLPLLLVIAGVTYLTVGHPILFGQTRVGRDGRRFEMLKFRTMTGTPEAAGEADAGWAAIQLDDEPPEVDEGVERTDRRTPFGRFLRKASLDELPQLWNVVRGDMSLVGPRPERFAYVEQFEQGVYRYDERHRVKAGITGWAQVHGLRGQTSLADRVEWDNYYIENWSLWLDLKIVFMTVSAVFTSREA
jgi:exopolysaccharide biosynthesis polyprenyl glycosylphosphotransferase